jgi:hypothetical protein
VGKYFIKTVLPIKRNCSTYQVKPFYLSSETVLPIKCNRSTYQTVLPFKRNVRRYPAAAAQVAAAQAQAAAAAQAAAHQYATAYHQYPVGLCRLIQVDP